ncbi:MAG: ClpX C4-type zinc finger protein, partial [Bacteroidota bacterium]|nr:ClpX C4-type zinc finger protein [Bacteroidota bacterium]
MAKVLDKCSFCGRNRDQAGLLIAGTTGNICSDCVERAYEMISEINGKKKPDP